MSKQRWAKEYAAVAEAHWTPERTRAVTDGKQLPFLPGPSAVMLRALGLLRRDAVMPPKQVRKYRQINHMLAVLATLGPGPGSTNSVEQAKVLLQLLVVKWQDVAQLIPPLASVSC